jgi:N-acetylglucosamine malate deacetylase 2
MADEPPPLTSHSPLDGVTSVLAVVAHPDDESFGLGALLAALTDRGTSADLLCFTRGEASTLRDGLGDLAEIRAEELRRATQVLGIGQTTPHNHPDGKLGDVDLDLLAKQVQRAVSACGPSHLLVFDQGGITGHPDHEQATRAALAAAQAAGLPVLAWAIPEHVASRLNTEFGTGFVGRRPAELQESIPVSRSRQAEAISCHRSQSTDNPVLRRRLELLGNAEHLRLLYQPGT